jgi:hypothetical protein
MKCLYSNAHVKWLPVRMRVLFLLPFYHLSTTSIHQILEKKWEYNGTVHQLFIDFKKTYNSVRREVLYNILIQYGIPVRLVQQIKMYLNKTCSEVHIGKICQVHFLFIMI